MTLMEAALGDSEIARLTGLPRRTVSGWRHGRGTRLHLRQRLAVASWRPVTPEAYAYLLGLYLGDGCIASTSRRSVWLVITLDATYPQIVDEAARSVARCFPDAVARRHPRSRGSAIGVQVSHPVLPFAFPQHGPGRKHLRPIRLETWQAAISRTYPRELLRGLIHSDGCRCLNRFSTALPSGRIASYEYPRYFFSNLSADIRTIFCDHCDLLGIRWTQSNERNISVSHRSSVALLDEFVGPKA